MDIFESLMDNIYEEETYMLILGDGYRDLLTNHQYKKWMVRLYKFIRVGTISR